VTCYILYGLAPIACCLYLLNAVYAQNSQQHSKHWGWRAAAAVVPVHAFCTPMVMLLPWQSGHLRKCDFIIPYRPCTGLPGLLVGW